jgi:hypothetical protein
MTTACGDGKRRQDDCASGRGRNGRVASPTAARAASRGAARAPCCSLVAGSGPPCRQCGARHRHSGRGRARMWLVCFSTHSVCGWCALCAVPCTLCTLHTQVVHCTLCCYCALYPATAHCALLHLTVHCNARMVREGASGACACCGRRRVVARRSEARPPSLRLPSRRATTAAPRWPSRLAHGRHTALRGTPPRRPTHRRVSVSPPRVCSHRRFAPAASGPALPA